MALPKWLKGENLLLILTIIGVVLGIVIGLAISLGIDGEPKLSPRGILTLQFPGILFLRALKLLILPLITSSLINSIVNLDPKSAGRVGGIATLFYFTTTLLAVVTGIILVMVIQPGARGDDEEPLKAPPGSAMSCGQTIPTDTIFDLVRNMVPDNIIDAMSISESSCVRNVTLIDNQYVTDDTYAKGLASGDFVNTPRVWYGQPYQVDKNGMNILGLVCFSLIFGFFISLAGEAGRPLAELLRSLEYVIMKMVSAVIWLSPIGICFLIAGEIANMKDFGGEISRLGIYMVTVIAGLFIHAFITLPILLVVFGKRNPLKYSFGMLQAYMTAFGTSSSSATMPITLECLEHKNDISTSISRFVIPLGATINMDGTALYEAVAAIYISQSVGNPVGIGNVILISLTATLASIGAAGIPSAGLVTMLMVLMAIGVDPKFFTLIVPVDWLLDRIRTTVNVHGDSYGAAIVQRWCPPSHHPAITHNDEKVTQNGVAAIHPDDIRLNEYKSQPVIVSNHSGTTVTIGS